MPYQDVWVAGKTRTVGSRHCAARYAMFEEIVKQFNRPISLLDLGANQGYFGLRMAYEHRATSVMVDGQEALIRNVAANALPNTIAVKKRFTVDQLETWSKAEHFDVVLCLNVLHHFKDDYARAVKAVLNFGEHIIIETPAKNETAVFNPEVAPKLVQLFEAENPDRLLGYAPSFASKKVRRPIYYFYRRKKQLEISYHKPSRKHEARPNKHTIVSTFDKKRMTIPVKGDSHKWIHGMNLQNFIMWGGGYPSKKAIIRMVRKAVAEKDQHHGDIRPWNFILAGDRVHLIDWTDRRNVHQDDEGLEKTIAMIEKGLKR